MRDPTLNPMQDLLNIIFKLNWEQSSQLSLVIFNDGAPVHSDDLERIFQMHYSTKNEQENMGLGLAIVKKIILDHGGEICCLNIEKGAAFQINLPLLVNKSAKEIRKK